MSSQLSSSDQEQTARPDLPPKTLNDLELSRDVAPNMAFPWVVRLRYGIVFGGALILAGMAYSFRLDIPIGWTFAPLAIVLLSNFLCSRLPRLATRFPQETLGGMFVLDALCLTVLLGLTGGPMNPFSLLYLVQITLSAVVLRKSWTWALGLLSTACFASLFFFNVPSAAFSSHEAHQGLSPHLAGMWIAFVVAAALIAFFTGKVSDAMRRREQEVLALQEQVSKHERLASLATLAAGAAHELGTPLGTIAVVARELERYAASLANDAVREDAKLIRSQVERCRLILQRMSAEGAEPMGETARAVDAGKLLDEVRCYFPEALRGSLQIGAPSGLAAVLPVQATVQSLVALVQNALDANRDGSRIVLEARGAGPEITFSVTDCGQGMSEAVLRRVAEPFFTTKEPGKGMGLGTFLVRTFAERLGGSLSFESLPGKGTTATLTLPARTPTEDGVHVTG